MINAEQYLALSSLTYFNFSDQARGRTVSALSGKEGELTQDLKNKPELAALSSMGDWKLLAHQPNTPSGFAASAFQSPEGQITFTFRGTEPKPLPDPIKTVSDFLTDAQISIDGLGSNKAGQFPDTLAFIRSTIEKASGKSSLTNSEIANYVRDNNVTFTGHSLGGGLAQYAYNLFKKYLAPTYALALQ